MAEALIERVARLLAKQVAHHCGKDDATSTGFSNAAWADYLGDARAILSGLRNPTAAELERAIQDNDRDAWIGHVDFWNAMIDAAVSVPSGRSEEKPAGT